MTDLRRRVAATALAVGAALALSLPAAAQMGAGSGMSGPMGGEKAAMPENACRKWPMAEPAWRSTLTAEQRVKMDRMHLALKKEMNLLEGKIGLRKAELKNLVTADMPDEKEIHSKIDEIIALKKEMMTKKYDHVVELRGILTPEQRTSFDMMFLGWMHHMGGGMMSKGPMGGAIGR